MGPRVRAQRAADMLVAFAPLLCERRARVTPTRTRAGLAETLRWVSDNLFLEVEGIVLVCDNPSTHLVGSPCEASLPGEAGRLVSRPEAHHTPKHGSWPAHGGDRGRSSCAARPSGARRELRRDGASHGRLGGRS